MARPWNANPTVGQESAYGYIQAADFPAAVRSADEPFPILTIQRAMAMEVPCSLYVNTPGRGQALHYLSDDWRPPDANLAEGYYIYWPPTNAADATAMLTTALVIGTTYTCLSVTPHSDAPSGVYRVDFEQALGAALPNTDASYTALYAQSYFRLA